MLEQRVPHAPIPWTRIQIVTFDYSTWNACRMGKLGVASSAPRAAPRILAVPGR